MTQEEKNKAQEAYDMKKFKMCSSCYRGHMEVWEDCIALQGKRFIVFVCSYCGLKTEHMASKLLGKLGTQENNEDTLTEELVDILISEITNEYRIPWMKKESLLEELKINKLEDLPKYRFWEAIISIKKGRRK